MQFGRGQFGRGQFGGADIGCPVELPPISFVDSPVFNVQLAAAFARFYDSPVFDATASKRARFRFDESPLFQVDRIDHGGNVGVSFMDSPVFNVYLRRGESQACITGNGEITDGEDGAGVGAYGNVAY